MNPFYLSLNKALLILATSLILTISAISQNPRPLDLEQALDLAMENNFEMLRAEAKLEGIEGSLIRVKSGRLPQLELIARFNQIDTGLLETFGGSSFGSDRSWAVDLQLTQAIYHGRRDRSAIGRENANLAAAKAEIEETLLNVILLTKEAWYQIILSRELIKVQEESRGLLREEFERSQNRFETGNISRFELLRAEVALANSNPPLIRAKNDYRLAIVDLYRIIGLPAPDDATEIVTGEFHYDALEIEINEALSLAKANRSQFTVLEQQQLAAESQVKLQRADYLPMIDFVAGYGIQKSAFSDQLDETIDGWTVGIQGNWNLWDSGQTKGSVLEAQANLRNTELAANEFELTIELAIRRAVSDLEEAKELVNASEKVVEQAEEALKLAKDRYAVGAAIQLDLLDAEVALTEAKTNAISSKYEYNLAKARLERELGLRVLAE